MNRVVNIFVLLLLFVNEYKSQNKPTKQSPPKRYTVSEVLDSIEGIQLYNKYITVIEKDSVRLNKEGTKAQGWIEDYYQSGKMLHKGFYKDGKLELFRNFYENGKNERVMATIDSMRVNIDMYYDNGNKRKQTNYINGISKRVSAFYPTGLLKSVTDNDVEKKQLISKKTWFESGQLSSEMFYDLKSKKYLQKTYHPNGKIFESGQMTYSAQDHEYHKTGIWISLDAEGKNKKIEKFTAPKSNSN